MKLPLTRKPSTICTPATDTETVIEVYSGPHWDRDRWVWFFMMYHWNNSPAYCGACGRCTNPNNVEPCGHPEALRHVRGQAYLSSLEETEKRVLAAGNSIRYVRDGRTIHHSEAKYHG